jgi:hypothetical protein
MMKKYFFTIFAAMLLGMPAARASLACYQGDARMAQGKKAQPKAKSLEVSFNYQKQAGPGSNQYAVWIENEKGEVVKTLFVTSFTTKGRVRGNERLRVGEQSSGMQPMRGYVKRPNCVPTWVKTVKANDLSDQQLDAVTGATPQAGGKQIFTWDFTDQQGKKVKQGKYRVIVEATLYQASDIIYSGTFSTQDKAGNVALTSKLTEPKESHQGMITDVKAVLK